MPQFWLQYCLSPSFIYCFIFGLNPKKTYVTPGWLKAHRGEKEKKCNIASSIKKIAMEELPNNSMQNRSNFLL